MKTTFSIAALAFVSSIHAIDLNINSEDSVGSAARIVAEGLVSYYNGDEPGEIPGLLPDPYYWWTAGSMFNSLIEYWHLTGDSQFNDITLRGVAHQIGQQDFMPINQSRSIGNDDIGNWAMAAMTAAERNFPALPQDTNTTWLDLVRNVFELYTLRWDDETCGGGLKWQVFSFNGGYNYKNSGSTGALFNIASRLARFTGNETYADWADKAWSWLDTVGLLDTTSYHVFDGADDLKDCREINNIQWTKDAGILLHGAAAMLNHTGSGEWRSRVESFTDEGLDVFFNDDIMIEVACEPYDTCDLDQKSFKAALARAMGSTLQLAPFTAEQILPRLQASAAGAAQSCTGDANQACGFRWNTTFDDSTGVSEQLAALEAIQQLLSMQASPPVTSENAAPVPSNGTQTQTGGNGSPSGTVSGLPAPTGSGERLTPTFLLAISLLAGAWVIIL